MLAPHGGGGSCCSDPKRPLCSRSGTAKPPPQSKRYSRTAEPMRLGGRRERVAGQDFRKDPLPPSFLPSIPGGGGGKAGAERGGGDERGGKCQTCFMSPNVVVCPDVQVSKLGHFRCFLAYVRRIVFVHLPTYISHKVEMRRHIV